MTKWSKCLVGPSYWIRKDSSIFVSHQVGIGENFVNVMDKEGEGFKKRPFSTSEAKMKEGIFTGLDIRKVICNCSWRKTQAKGIRYMEIVYKSSKRIFMQHIRRNHKTLVEDILKYYWIMGYQMSLNYIF